MGIYLLIYSRSDKLYNRNDRIKETRQEHTKQCLDPAIR